MKKLPLAIQSGILHISLDSHPLICTPPIRVAVCIVCYLQVLCNDVVTVLAGDSDMILQVVQCVKSSQSLKKVS